MASSFSQVKENGEVIDSGREAAAAQ